MLHFVFTSVLQTCKKHIIEEHCFVNTKSSTGFKQLVYLFVKCITVSHRFLVAITFLCPSFHQLGYKKFFIHTNLKAIKISCSLASGTGQQFIFQISNILSLYGYFFNSHEISPSLKTNLKNIR